MKNSAQTPEYRLESAINTTQCEIDSHMTTLKDHAKYLIRSAQQAQEMLDALEAGNDQPVYTAFFEFELQNCQRAVETLKTLSALGNKKRTLEYIGRNDEE